MITLLMIIQALQWLLIGSLWIRTAVLEAHIKDLYERKEDK